MAFVLSTTGVPTAAAPPEPHSQAGRQLPPQELLPLPSTAGKTIGRLVFCRFHLRAILQPDDLHHGMNYLARGVASTQRSVSHAKKNRATSASDASSPKGLSFHPGLDVPPAGSTPTAAVENALLGFNSISNYSLPATRYHSSISHAESFTSIPNWMKSL